MHCATGGVILASQAGLLTTSSAWGACSQKGSVATAVATDLSALPSISVQSHRLFTAADPSLALSLYRTAPGVLEQYEHLNKVHPASHSQPASAASASAAGEGGPAGGGASSSGGGAAEGQPGGAGASPVADSDILKTDSPGAGETQHPGETSPGVMEPKASGRWGEQQQCCCASAAAAADTQCWLIAAGVQAAWLPVAAMPGLLPVMASARQCALRRPVS